MGGFDRRSIPSARHRFDLELDVDGVFSLLGWFEWADFEKEVKCKVDFMRIIRFSMAMHTTHIFLRTNFC